MFGDILRELPLVFASNTLEDREEEDSNHWIMPDIMQEPITVFSDIPTGKARLSALIETFEQKYGHKASYVARAPGRVGE